MTLRLINQPGLKICLFAGLLLLGGSGQAETPLADEQLAEIMSDAREAMREKQYEIAIKNYRQLADLQDHAYRRDALELLGLAYERNGQLTEAKASYQRYLQYYPEGVASERVRQRLAGLTTAAWSAPKPLQKAKQQSDSSWRHYGSFSQYLRRDANRFEQQSEVVNNFTLSSQLDLSSRGKSENWSIRSRFSGGHTQSLQSGQDNQQQLSYLYLDMQQRQGEWGFRFGRQRASGGGVLGRFDGLSLTRQLAGKQRLNLLVGMPVARTSDTTPNSDKLFFGLNLQSALWAEYWQASGYIIEQRYNGLLDRQAVGGELRYQHPERTLYSLLDYDLSYSMLNIANLQASYRLKDKSSLNLLLDYRASPAITTGNALIGQQVESLDELRKLYSEEMIRQMAKRRTPHNYLASVGISKPFSETIRLDLDLSASNLSATSEFAGVLGTPGTSTEYFVMARLNVNELWRKGGINRLSLRFANSDTNRATTLTLSSRQLVTQWHITPRLQWDQRNYDNGDGQRTIAPGVRVEYRWQSGHLFEFDAGWEATQRDTWLGTQDNQSSYYSLGYRWQF